MCVCERVDAIMRDWWCRRWMTMLMMRMLLLMLILTAFVDDGDGVVAVGIVVVAVGGACTDKVDEDVGVVDVADDAAVVDVVCGCSFWCTRVCVCRCVQF